jgi:hypothetical protein
MSFGRKLQNVWVRGVGSNVALNGREAILKAGKITFLMLIFLGPIP